MRILHVVKKFPPLIGGDATVVVALRRVQERAGHEVTVLTYNPPVVFGTEGEVEDARVHRVGPSQPGASLDRITLRRVRGMLAMRRWAGSALPSLRPDVLHAHAVDVAYAVAPVARKCGVPLVLTCHGVWFPHRGPRSFGGRLELYLIRHGRPAVITSVDAASVAALRGAGFDAQLVPNGVEADEFAGPHTEPDPPVFLFAGRHEPQKGLDILLVAAALLRDEGAAFRIVLLGDGSLTSDLRRQAHNLGLDRIVTFAGRLPERADVVRAYLGASAFVLPSRFEGFPVTVLEAWAAGLPVVASAVGGVVDVCTEANAVLVPSRNPQALAKAMAGVLADPGLRRRLGDAGRSLVRERYTWDAVASRYSRLYEEAGAATGR